MASFQLKEIGNFTREMLSAFTKDNVFSLAAALAYYTIFSLAPILLIVITIVGFFFGEEAMRGEIYGELSGMMGDQAAKQVQEMVENARARESGTVATLISIVTLVFGATGVFNELKSSLNNIWGVKSKPKNGIWGMVKDRLLSFGMVLSLGFIMLVALVINAVVAMAGSYFSSVLPEAGEVFLQIFNLLLSVGVSTLLFAVLFKGLPDVNIKYSDVWKGALFTAILFSVGKWAIGLYIGQSDIGGTYGAAGSMVVILVWVYYSALILFLGAEFTAVYADRYGAHLRPSAHAVRVITKEVNDKGEEINEDQGKAPHQGEKAAQPSTKTGGHR